MSEYDSVEDEEKVEEENTKSKGLPVRATGGTCEFKGNEIEGTPAQRSTMKMSSTITHDQTSNAMEENARASCSPHREEKTQR